MQKITLPAQPCYETVIKKIPGFIKSTHHGECAAYYIDDNVLVAHLAEQQLLSSSQGEWILARTEWKRTDVKPSWVEESGSSNEWCYAIDSAAKAV
jgi:hypothetical protein